MTLNEFANRVFGEDEELELMRCITIILRNGLYIQDRAIALGQNGTTLEEMLEDTEASLGTMLVETVRMIRALGYSLEDMAYDITGE